ncbi:MAG: (2Fe-2S)-binding protein [Burkholderiaceae bacterium]
MPTNSNCAHVTGPGIRLHVNGQAHALAVPRDAPLLYVLRNDLGLNGPKYGCGLGECGACTVLVDGTEARSCVIPVGGVEGRHITTLEGLGTPDHLHPVQQAFIECQAAQCGYCLNGMIVSSVALLARCPQPTDPQVREALAHNLCRCGAHLEILQAVQRAAERMQASGPGRGSDAPAKLSCGEVDPTPAGPGPVHRRFGSA